MPRRRQLSVVALLLGLACLVQWQVIQRAVAPAADAVRYIAIAQQMTAVGVRTAILRDADQPLFPAFVAALHARLAANEADRPTSWLCSAQVVASVAVILSLISVYWLLNAWLGRQKALLGTLIYLSLPEVARLGADGLSDSLHLFWFVTALATIGSVLATWPGQPASGGDSLRHSPPRNWRAIKLYLAGIATGLALLVRSEALILAVATVLAIGWIAVRHVHWQRPGLRREALILAATYSLGAASIFGPYLVWSESMSPRLAAARLIGSHRADAGALLNDPLSSNSQPSTTGERPASDWRLLDGQGFEFGRKDFSQTSRRFGVVFALLEYFAELAQLSYYVIGLLAAWGAWKMRRSPRATAGGYLAFLFAFYSLAVVAHAAMTGYLSTRHLLPLAPLAVGWASHGIVVLSTAVVASVTQFSRTTVETQRLCGPAMAKAAAAIVVIAILPATLGPLHASRWGHRRAGDWIAANSSPDQCILDTHGWTGLYSGRQTFRHEYARAAFNSRALRYVVIERDEIQARSNRARTLNALLDTSAHLVASFQPPDASPTKSVLIYQWNPDRFTARFGNKLKPN